MTTSHAARQGTSTVVMVDAEDPVIYKLDMTRVTFSEFFEETHNPLILIPAAVIKWFKVNYQASADDLNVESLSDFERPYSELSDDVVDRFAPLIPQMIAMGFASTLYHRINDNLQKSATHLLSYIHRSGRYAARTHLRFWKTTTPHKEYLSTEYFTQFTDGTFLWSLNSKPDLNTPPECVQNRIRKADAKALFASHEEVLQELLAEGKVIKPVRSEQELRVMLEAQQKYVRNYHLLRGVFRLPTEKELAMAAPAAKIMTRQPERSTAGQTGTVQPQFNPKYAEEDEAILEEIEKLENKKSGWISAIILLAVSLLLFVVASKSDYSLKDLYILLGVLVFHEMGHYLAMRMFGYRNVRMFFIPFLGAAVSGKHYNVAGWKKIVVSLAGPVPGIVVGIGLGIAGLMTKNQIMSDIALMALILNGFNLLPVLPLDGGHVAHALLFCRHHKADLVFRLLALFAMIALAVLSGSRGIVAVIVGGVMTLPVTYRLARVTTELRKSGFQPVSLDSCTIAPDSARTIIGKIRESHTKPVANKVLAQQTLGVFETLNARPPGIWVSLLFGSIHSAAFCAAIICALVFAVIPRMDLFSEMAAAGLKPLETEMVMTQSAESNDAKSTNENMLTIVANFEKSEKAAAAYAGLQFLQTKPTHSTLFGHTVVASVSESNKQVHQILLEYFKPLSKQITEGRRDKQVQLSLGFRMNDAEKAEKIRNEVQEYLAVSTYNAIAPWDQAYVVDAAKHAQWELARHTLTVIQQEENKTPADTKYFELYGKLAQAKQTEDTERIKAIEAKIKAQQLKRHDDAMAAVRALPAGQIDLDVLNDYAKIPQMDNLSEDLKKTLAEREAGMKTMASRFGVIDMQGDAGKPKIYRFKIMPGYVTESVGESKMIYLECANAHEGPLTLLKWLQDQGATHIRYELVGAFPSFGDDDDLGDEKPAK